MGGREVMMMRGVQRMGLGKVFYGIAFCFGLMMAFSNEVITGLIPR